MGIVLQILWDLLRRRCSGVWSDDREDDARSSQEGRGMEEGNGAIRALNKKRESHAEALLFVFSREICKTYYEKQLAQWWSARLKRCEVAGSNPVLFLF